MTIDPFSLETFFFLLFLLFTVKTLSLYLTVKTFFFLLFLLLTMDALFLFFFLRLTPDIFFTRGARPLDLRIRCRHATRPSLSRAPIRHAHDMICDAIRFPFRFILRRADRQLGLDQPGVQESLHVAVAMRTLKAEQRSDGVARV
jgi:hypothetical protein